MDIDSDATSVSTLTRVLIGAHVSPAGGPANAVKRGEALGAQAIQIFHQNPRAWKPREYTEAQVTAFADAMAGSTVKALVIHAVYLLNTASDDADIASKTLTSLVSCLRAGDRLNAAAVVLHPGSAKTGNVDHAISRAGRVIAEALAETDACPLHLENTAGTGGTLGRSFSELAARLDAAGGSARLGVCLDSCHLFASGHDIRTVDGLTTTIDAFDAEVGLGRLGSLHLNDSQTELGANRDRHANIGAGELGDDGCAAFLSEPRFESLPVILETPGPDRSGPTSAEIEHCHALRVRGQVNRG